MDTQVFDFKYAKKGNNDNMANKISITTYLGNVLSLRKHLNAHAA